MWAQEPEGEDFTLLDWRVHRQGAVHAVSKRAATVPATPRTRCVHNSPSFLRLHFLTYKMEIRVPTLILNKEIEYDEGFDLCCGFFHCVFKCPGGKAESELLTPSGEGLSLTTWSSLKLSKRNNH